jgi:general secretion pathway protein D
MYGGGYGGGMYGGGYGGGGYGGGGYGGGYGGGGYGGGQFPMAAVALTNPTAQAQTTAPGATTPASADQTGTYLGYGNPFLGPGSKVPRVIPNPMDNTLLIQATPQDYQEILKLLHDLDVSPRQVLVEAKIYEVNLQGEFSSGVQAYLQNKNAALPSGFSASRALAAISTGSSLGLSAGMLVGNSRQLAAVLSASEQSQRAKLISAPRLIATDSIAATMNVGDSVPILNSQAASGITNGGTSQIVQGIQNVQTGVTLNVLARVTPGGIVTMKIQQEVSSPVAPSAGASIQSPSFTQRSFTTQVTMQDGDTIAIGGIISESDTYSSSGIPFLHRIPVLGAAFGSKSVSKTRTEMVVLMTPHIIYDTNQIVEASEELKSGFNRLRTLMKE